MIFLILSEITDEIFVHEVDEYLINIKLEGQEQEWRENVLGFNTTHYLLHESDLVQLPLYCLRVLVQSLLLSRLFLGCFAFQCWMLSNGKDIQSFLSVNLKNLHEKVTKYGLFFFILEYALLLDVFYQFVATLAFVVDIIQNVDS
jgi:hypothetical protein